MFCSYIIIKCRRYSLHMASFLKDYCVNKYFQPFFNKGSTTWGRESINVAVTLRRNGSGIIEKKTKYNAHNLCIKVFQYKKQSKCEKL